MLSTRRHHAIEHIEPVDPKLLEGGKIQPGHPLFGLIWINSKRVSGVPCFFGTRVPIRNLFDSLAAGETLEDSLDGFEGVTREQALAILDLAGEDLLNELEQA